MRTTANRLISHGEPLANTAVFTLPDAMPAPTSGVAYPRLKKNSSAAPTSGVFDVVVDTNVSNAARIGDVQGVSNCDQISILYRHKLSDKSQYIV